MKVALRYSEGIDQPIATPQWAMLFDLTSDPNELHNLVATKMDIAWMLGVALKLVADFARSVAVHPNIKTGAAFDGYH